ncbi:hypothetical protein MTO96_016928 [Rhipicephalus appendiculatus]
MAYMLGQIGKADETPVWFDMPSSTTVCGRGAKEVKLLPTGSEHSRFTVMLSCTADDRKLPPFIIFKRKTLPKEALPRDVVVRVNEKGTCGEVGFSQLVRSCLEAELETLDTLQLKVCSLVVDEMRIKQKLLYRKQRDTFVGDVDLGVGEPHEPDPDWEYPDWSTKASAASQVPSPRGRSSRVSAVPKTKS